MFFFVIIFHQYNNIRADIEVVLKHAKCNLTLYYGTLEKFLYSFSFVMCKTGST